MTRLRAACADARDIAILAAVGIPIVLFCTALFGAAWLVARGQDAMIERAP